MDGGKAAADGFDVTPSQAMLRIAVQPGAPARLIALAHLLRFQQRVPLGSLLHGTVGGFGGDSGGRGHGTVHASDQVGVEQV